MIKKFEEFINESYDKVRWTMEEKREMRNILMELFDDKRVVDALDDRMINSDYTFDEVLNILNCLNIFKSEPNYMAAFLKELFDPGISVEEKNKFINKMCDKFNDGNDIPIVIDDNTGKIMVDDIYNE